MACLVSLQINPSHPTTQTAPMEAGATQTMSLPDPDFPISIHTENMAANK